MLEFQGMTTETPAAQQKVNLRRPDIMAAVQAQVLSHYRSNLVERIRAEGHILSAGDLTVKLAKEFGFCYGVERAIDLAYAACRAYPDRRIFLLGEIIHNPEVNDQLRRMGIVTIAGKPEEEEIDLLRPEDIVIMPAFGTEVFDAAEAGGQGLPVRGHDLRGRDERLETGAAVFQGLGDEHHPRQGPARGDDGDHVPGARPAAGGITWWCLRWPKPTTSASTSWRAAIRPSSSKSSRAPIRRASIPTCTSRPSGSPTRPPCCAARPKKCSAGCGRRWSARYGEAEAAHHFRFFDTICGATQDRQDALEKLLREPIDLLLVIGGYNSSNTSHLAEMGEAKLPTYFIKNAAKMVSDKLIIHYNQHIHQEVEKCDWLPGGKVIVGITAGASCPNNLIEDAIRRLFELRGISVQQLLAVASAA